jgi:predicted transcriptional regulator
MYGANLSFRQLERYLELLLDRGLLRVSEEPRSKATKLFATTERGMSFLEAYHTLKEIVRKKNRF